MNYLISKVSKRIGILGRTRRSIPVIDYCNTVWSCCGCVNADNVEKIQRCMARIIMQMESSDDALAHLKYDMLGLR